MEGVLERPRVRPETLALLEQKRIPAHVLPTAAAIRPYNELAATPQVGGVFHSTCRRGPFARANFTPVPATLYA